MDYDGKPAFVELPIDEYRAIQERLEDLEDLPLLRETEGTDKRAKGRLLEDVLRELGLPDR